MQTTKKSAVKGARWTRLFSAASPSGPAFDGRLHERDRNVGLVLFAGVSVLSLFLFTGCGPAGPRAVLHGRDYLEKGDYAHAIEELRAATLLMPTNAVAFSYLGLAYHQAGQVAEAERAYHRALALDKDMSEVLFNLGCLWLSQSNKLDQAKSELIAFTMRQPNSADGWLRLGQAQLRSRELAAAERSFGEGLRISPQNPELLTDLGLVRYQRRRINEAGQCFAKALKEHPHYAPAILNLAIIAQQDLGDLRLALQRYREYLSLIPAPEHAQSVSAIVRQLELEINPPPRETVTNQATQPPAQHADVIVTNKAAEPVRSVATEKPGPATTPHPAPLAKSEPPTNSGRTVATPPVSKTSSAGGLTATDKLETVKLAAEPVIKPAQDLNGSSPTAAPSTPEPPVEYTSSTPVASDSKTPKKGFFQKINPMNLFGHDDKTGTPPPPSVTMQPDPNAAVSTAGNAAARNFPRYAYRFPAKPLSGDRELAEKAFSEGVQNQQARRLPEAIQAYRKAAQLDPAYYDANYNLGLAASENGNLPLALAAYETALAIEPESLDARYNFGLVLKQAGYVMDSVSQFEKILAKYPNDGRTHLALGNLYAQQLQDTAKARQHYQAALALAPQSPQAGAIRYWLSDHPK